MNNISHAFSDKTNEKDFNELLLILIKIIEKEEVDNN